MAIYLKQSTAATISFGPFTADGVTAVTSLVSALDHASTGIMLSKNGGALAVRHATVTATTYDAYANYIVTLDTTDTNTLGRLRVQFYDGTRIPVWMNCSVLAANSFDAFISGTDDRLGIKRQNTAAGGTTSSITLDASASTVDDFYVGDFILCSIDGVLDGLVCIDYDGTSKVATMETTWKGGVAPDSNDAFYIFAGSPGISSAVIAESIFTRDMGAKFDSRTFAELCLVLAAANAGKASGLPIAPVYRDLGDSQDVITATTDLNGNRSAVTLLTTGA